LGFSSTPAACILRRIDQVIQTRIIHSPAFLLTAGSRVKEVRRQTVTHKRFKRLVHQWIDLSIEHSRLTMQIAEPRASR